MIERDDWEENTYAGLDELDDAGQERVASLAPPRGDVDDEPELGSLEMPAFEPMEGLEDGARLA